MKIIFGILHDLQNASIGRMRKKGAQHKTKLINNFTSCRVSGFEDLDVGACWRSVNVTWSKSLDEFKKERFFSTTTFRILLWWNRN